MENHAKKIIAKSGMFIATHVKTLEQNKVKANCQAISFRCRLSKGNLNYTHLANARDYKKVNLILKQGSF